MTVFSHTPQHPRRSRQTNSGANHPCQLFLEVQATEKKRVSLRVKTPWYPLVVPCRGLDEATMNRPRQTCKTDLRKLSGIHLSCTGSSPRNWQFRSALWR